MTRRLLCALIGLCIGFGTVSAGEDGPGPGGGPPFPGRGRFNDGPSEEQLAVDYLNAVRAAPGNYSGEIKADLSGVKPQPALTPNDILKKVAQEKADDIARRGYKGHINPEGEGLDLKIQAAGYPLPTQFKYEKSSNTFESLHE